LTPGLWSGRSGDCRQSVLRRDPVRSFVSASRREPANEPDQIKLFEALHRNAPPATEFFRIPLNRVIELGGRIEI
jgi:KUP system potassium uptake protein